MLLTDIVYVVTVMSFCDAESQNNNHCEREFDCDLCGGFSSIASGNQPAWHHQQPDPGEEV